MRRMIVLNRISVDGYFASNEEATWGMDWFVQDPEVDMATHERIQADTLVLGGATFRGFERMWVPLLGDPHAPPPLKALAQELTAMKKVVFSERLVASQWENTQSFTGKLAEVVADLKQQEGSDILVLGSGAVVRQLAQEHLIDEYLLIGTPVVAGRGKALFTDVPQQKLTLREVKGFASGNVLLHYEVQR